MDRRTLLKLLGGVAALPALGKAIKGTGIKSVKTAGKILPKVEGMPEWFGPLVNKIMKEGVDISPTVKRVEDMTTVKKLEVPSATGEPEVITLTQNKITGEITIEANVYGGVADAPFELNYKPPKTDIDVKTGKVIKEPGDFSVVEQRPRPIGGPEDADFEFDYEYLRLEDAYSDVEKLEKIATGKIKDAKKIEERAAGRKMIEQSPYEDIINRYPDPDINDYDVDFANGGLASFANGGLIKPGKVISKIENPTAGVVFNPGPYEGPYEGPYILGGPRPGQYYQSSPIRAIIGPDGTIPRPDMPMMSSPSTPTPQVDVSANPIARSLEMAGFTREEIMRILGQQGFADGGLTKTVPPAMGPDSQGVETLFRRRYS